MHEIPAAAQYTGIYHFIPPNLAALELTKPDTCPHITKMNTLVWIGGMGDTLGSIEYPFTLAQSLGSSWSLVTCSLSSTGAAWGIGSLARDAEDLAEITSYFRSRKPNGKIIIMGHSTGCQGCMEYVVGRGAEERSPVDGVILQAPVSDREALDKDLSSKHEVDLLASKMCSERQAQDVLPARLTRPAFGRTPITARRWLDISSPGPDHRGSDDYFSSDLPISRLRNTFGKMRPPLLILYSGKDESHPHVDAGKLIQTWANVLKQSGGSIDVVNGGIIAGASHNLVNNPNIVVQELVARVTRFLERIDNGFGQIISSAE